GSTPDRSEALTIGAERHVLDSVAVFQGLEWSLRTCRAVGIEVPNPGGPIPAGRGQKLSVGADGYTANMPCMGREIKPLLTGARVPQCDFSILAARDDPPAIGTKHSAEHGGSVV